MAKTYLQLNQELFDKLITLKKWARSNGLDCNIESELKQLQSTINMLQKLEIASEV